MRFHFGKATKILGQTLPYVLLRLAIGIAFGLLTVLYFGGIGAAIFFFFDLSSPSWWILLLIFGISLAGYWGMVRLVRKYVLYLVSAGHIATIAHIVDTGDVPDNQFRFGKNKVTGRFYEASGLFVVDKLVQAVLNQFNSAAVSFSKLVNFVPALQNIIRIIRKTITLAGRHLDHAILAYMFLHEDKGKWTAARDGLVLYAKTWKPVLATAMLIVLGMYVFMAALTVMATPTALLLSQFGTFGEIIGWATVLGIVATVHFGIVDPWVKTVLITTFLIESEDTSPDSETMDLVESKADDFQEVLKNAVEEEDESKAEGTPSSEPDKAPAVDD